MTAPAGGGRSRTRPSARRKERPRCLGRQTGLARQGATEFAQSTPIVRVCRRGRGYGNATDECSGRGRPGRPRLFADRRVRRALRRRGRAGPPTDSARMAARPGDQKSAIRGQRAVAERRSGERRTADRGRTVARRCGAGCRAFGIGRGRRWKRCRRPGNRLRMRRSAPRVKNGLGPIGWRDRDCSER
jgi:hypothetical protein